jgi:hypothetical protein
MGAQAQTLAQEVKLLSSKGKTQESEQGWQSLAAVATISVP